MDLPWDSWLHQKLPFFSASTGGLASNDRSKAGQAQNRAFRRTSPLGFPENLESSREGSWTLRCFLEAKLWIVLDFVSWLWIGRFFESSQDCELTRVQSSSKNTFKKKGWVKLSVCQNLAVRNARGCGSEDEIQPTLWPSVLPSMTAKLCQIVFQKRSRSESRLHSLFKNECSPGSLRPLHLPTQRKSSWFGFVDFTDASDVDHSTFDSSQCASRMVKDHQKDKKEILLLCTVKMAWFKD